MKQQVAVGVFSIFVFCFMWEHVGRFHNAFRPTVALEFATAWYVVVFYRIGELLAWASSFLHWVHLEELYETFLLLTAAVCRLVTSPFFEVLRGYLEYALSLRYAPVVVVGTLILVGAPLVYIFGCPKIQPSQKRREREKLYCVTPNPEQE